MSPQNVTVITTSLSFLLADVDASLLWSDDFLLLGNSLNVAVSLLLWVAIASSASSWLLPTSCTYTLSIFKFKAAGLWLLIVVDEFIIHIFDFILVTH